MVGNRSRITGAAILMVASFATPSVALGESDLNVEECKQKKSKAEAEIEECRALETLSLHRTLNRQHLQDQMSGNGNGVDSSVALRLSTDSKRFDLIVKSETGSKPDVEGYGSSNVSLKVSAPVNNFKEHKELPSIADLTRGTTAELSYEFFRVNVITKDIRRVLANESAKTMGQLAIKAANLDKGSACYDRVRKTIQSDAGLPTLEGTLPESLNGIDFLTNPREGVLGVCSEVSGLTSDDSRDMKAYIKTIRGDIARTVWGGSIGAKVGYEKVTHYSPVDYAGQTDENTPWSVKAQLQVRPYFLNERMKFQASVELMEKYKPAKEEIKCRPGDVPEISECKSGAFSAPVRTEQILGSLGVKADFTGGKFPYAIAPTLTYDFESESAEFSLPIYLAAVNKKPAKGNGRKSLNSGIKVLFTEKKDSDKDGWSVGLFVDAPFSL